PLIRVTAIAVDTGLLTLLRRHLGDVTVTGLEINIPPRPESDGRPPGASDPGVQRDRSGRTNFVTSARDIVIDRLLSSDARLVIIPRERTKPSRVWAIHELEMRSVSFGRAMPFDATLTNAIP